MARTTKSRSVRQSPVAQEQDHKGEWPILEPLPEEDETAVVSTAAGLDEGLTVMSHSPGDDLTPDTLLGDHRNGHWATREDEGDRGVG